MWKYALCICACAFTCASALPQVKSVKGGGGGFFPYNATANLVRFWNNSDQFQQHNQQGVLQNRTMALDFERGVCYTEVPTASIVKTSGQIPAGNGSRPELSKIRVCCHGYIRNIHNFWLCDPVCSHDCINALCTAPETCSCYPDHVKNLAGICIPTCPIGCQNGHCSGGECMCKEGFRLDRDSKFCQPVCNHDCGNQGNCTAPNTCECRKGYQSENGTCRPHCDHCANGACVGPNECKCHQGYSSHKPGECVPDCPQGCGPKGHCSAPNVCSCQHGFQFDQSSRQCKPICTKPCRHGECVAPDDCRCNSGYTITDKGECIPVCGIGCGENGKCTGPNVCTCSPGYEYDEITHLCHAACSRPCVNGDCVGPNDCKCHSGFKKSQYGECVPDCPQCEDETYFAFCACRGCGVDGLCVAPNRCVCAPGVEPDPSTGKCGRGGNSQAGIPGACINGVSSGNVCDCNSGYVRDREDPTGNRCVPHCPGGCPNGVCSAPNFCICDMGYVKDRSVKGRQSCVRRNRRSISPEEDKPIVISNLVKLLTFELPEDY